MTLSLDIGGIEDPTIRRAFEQLLLLLPPQVAFTGNGAPTFTPGVSRALYVRQDGGAGSTLYVYEGTGWTAK